MTKIILASKSPRRRELLSQIGMEYECIVSDADENADKNDPGEFVSELARRKAHAVVDKCSHDSHIIIGADTVVVKDGNILGKPSDEADARRMLLDLQGNAHQVYTGVCLLYIKEGDIVEEDVFEERTTVHMYRMTDEEIEEYVKTGEPMDKAGSYGIQGIGASFIKCIEGDYNNIVGLPVARIYQQLREHDNWR